MRKLLTAVALVGVLVFLAAPAGAKKHHSHKPSGVAGTVFNSTCAGACAEPPPPEPVYTGAVTITVTRVSDGQQVASQAISDGHFRLRLKKGAYNVSSVPPNPPTCNPTAGNRSVRWTRRRAPRSFAPACRARRSRFRCAATSFTHVELHVSNVCVV